MNTKKNRCFNSNKASETVKVGNVNNWHFPLNGTAKFLLNYLKEDSHIPEDFMEELHRHFRMEPRSMQRQMAKSLLNVMIWGDCECWVYARTDDKDVNYWLNILFKKYCWYTHGFEYLRNLNYSLDDAKAFYEAVNDFYHKQHVSFKEFLNKKNIVNRYEH